MAGFTRATQAVAQDPTLRRTPYLAKCSAVAILKFLILFGKGDLHFHFVWESTNHVADPAATSHLTVTFSSPDYKGEAGKGNSGIRDHLQKSSYSVDEVIISFYS